MSLPVSRNISTFITNLRLLDLDLRDDWPNIQADLFSAKDVLANQKQRIRCVEWALYRLFELWNPKEAKNKLQPFFPPYDSLRSLNLRAALYRSINELKKDGALGKEIMLRKTIFDECKGERVEELLASFSTIVLQKIVRARHGNNSDFVTKLATSQRVKTHDQKSLLPLAIAHHGALKALLRRKQELKARYATLQKLLDAKEQELLGRVDDLARINEDLPSEAVSGRAMQDIRQHFDRDWQGDGQWANTIIEGDKCDAGDSLLDAPFAHVWAHVEDDTTDVIGLAAKQGLLQNLNGQVHKQQIRLQHWQKIQQGLIDGRPRSPKKVRGQTAPLGSRTPQSPLKFGYVEKMQRSDSIDAGLASPLLEKKVNLTYSIICKTSQVNREISQDEEVDSGIDMDLHDRTIHAYSDSLQGTPTRIVRPAKDIFHPDQPSQAESHDMCQDTSTVQNLHAKQDLSPSPNTQGDPAFMKQTTSLLERTRQSMAFTRLNTLLPDPAVNPSPSPSPDHQPSRQPQQEVEEHNASSLTERTRRSISLAPAPDFSQKRPHKYQQSKKFPRNQFETPKKQLEDVREATPPEILFSPEAEYASVFKSRPKVATSPNLSPDLLSISQWSGD
ncbi:MAG: hypothetical protein Q9220_004861 [cf. Caloplaca sp. 1 TL-2023]